MLIRDVFVACEQAYLLPPDSVSPDQVRQIQLLLLRNLMRALEAAAANSPEAFIKTTHLNHESMYKETQKLTHVCAARRLVKETGCAWPGGMRIKTIQAMPLARTGKATKAMKHSACASDHCFEFEHFRRTNLKVDVSYYIENVGNRFAALLRFSIPDIHDRFATAVNMVKSATVTPDISRMLNVAPSTRPLPWEGPVDIQRLSDLLARVEEPDEGKGDRSGARAFVDNASSRIKRPRAPDEGSTNTRASLNATWTQLLTPKVQAPEVRAAEKKAKIKMNAKAIAMQPRRTARNVVPRVPI